MPPPTETLLRERLAAGRDHLAHLAGDTGERGLADLLRRVDGAIGLLETGRWGTCCVCREAVGAEQLARDPLLSVCLDCLTPEARRALERDLETAGKVQRALLPEPFIRQDGWEVAHLWEPLGAMSGDHVDLIRPTRPGWPLHLILGDVAGKGVAASLLQAHLHALFRALALAGQPLTDLLAQANGLFAESTLTTSYATLAALSLTPAGRAELANAGHTPPLLVDARGVRPVEGGGLPLGLFPDTVYSKRELVLLPGQTLLLYTDGWTEGARGEEEFGIDRAAAALRRVSGLALPDLLSACRSALETFLDGEPRRDDLTLVAVRWTGA
jgi:sigma-B regulation protein RsbU (phosphoserine phosphatase)